MYIFNKVCPSLCHCPGLCPNDNAKLRHAAPSLHVSALCAIVRSRLFPRFPLLSSLRPRPTTQLYVSIFPHLSPCSAYRLCGSVPLRHIFVCAVPPARSWLYGKGRNDKGRQKRHAAGLVRLGGVGLKVCTFVIASITMACITNSTSSTSITRLIF